MFRSYALTLSAITLRGYTWLIDLTTLPISPRDTYILTAWLGWVPNLIVADLLIRHGWVKKMLRKQQPQNPTAAPKVHPQTTTAALKEQP